MSSPENKSYIDPEILRTMTPEGRDMTQRGLDSSELILRLEHVGPVQDSSEELTRFQKFKGFIGGLFA